MLLDLKIDKLLTGFRLSAHFACDAGVVVLFGPSGSGKSLTLKCLAGVIHPDGGRMALGSDALYDSALGISVSPQNRRMGYVPQSYSLFPHMSVQENIAFGLRSWSRWESRAAVGDLINMLHLSGLERKHPRELSGGQQQRVALARALAVRPRLLLLDEPFSALDAEIRGILRKDLAEVHHSLSTGMLLVTHDIVDVYSLGDTVAVYKDGKVLQVGPPSEVFQHPASVEVARLTGSWNILPGTISEVIPYGCAIDIGGVIVKAGSTSMVIGEPALVCINPGDARLVAKGDDVYPRESIIPCEIRSVALQGSSYSVEVAFKTALKPYARVLVPPWWWQRCDLSVGTSCWLAIDQASVRVFQKESTDDHTEQRIISAANV